MKLKSLVIFLLLTVLITSATFARTPPPVVPEDAAIVSFWTLNRISQAQPRDFIRDSRTGTFANPSKRPQRPQRWEVLGASWTNGGDVAKNTGRVYFQMGDYLYYCSASVVDEAVSDRSIIVTAAHCVYDESMEKTFATKWLFVPDYDANPVTFSSSFCDSTTLGCWTADSFVISQEYATAGSFNEVAVTHDYAFVVVKIGGKSDTYLDSEVGSQAITFSAQPPETKSWLFGYPAARKYKGDDLTYCLGPLSNDAAISNTTYRVPCDMTGGSSGGPWFRDFITDGSGTGTGTVFSINSYGYQGAKAMYGPIFNSETAAMYDLAKSTSSNILYGQWSILRP